MHTDRSPVRPPRHPCLWGTALALLAPASTPLTQAAEPVDRRSTDVSVAFEVCPDTSVTYDRSALRYQIEGIGLLALGVNAHLDEHWSLGFDLGLGIADFEPSRPVVPGELPQDYLRGSAGMFRFRLEAEYTFLTGPISPYLDGGFGMLLVTSEDEDEDPDWFDFHHDHDDGWWYDDGWGRPFDTETAFLFGVGGGIRWDISDEVYLKLGGRADWAIFPDAENPVPLPTAYVQAGMKF